MPKQEDLGYGDFGKTIQGRFNQDGVNQGETAIGNIGKIMKGESNQGGTAIGNVDKLLDVGLKYNQKINCNDATMNKCSNPNYKFSYKT